MGSRFSLEELRQYSRHIRLSSVGLEGQRKLKDASVLVVGAGGLGCPALMYLAAAGVGRIGIVEDDVIDVTNLHRQILYTHADVGLLKLKVAVHRLKEINKFVEFVQHPTRLTRETTEIISMYHVILDATDNFTTKYLINDACFAAARPLVYASISQFDGQMALFDMSATNDDSINLRDVFPEPPPSTLTKSCNEAGVLGVLPGILGTYQAAEAIKLILGIGGSSRNHLHLFDIAGSEVKRMRVRRRKDNPLRIGESVDIHASAAEMCAVKTVGDEMSPTVLERWIKDRRPLALIDVRQPAEHFALSLGGELWPDGTPAGVVTGPRARQVVVYCKSGTRSKLALRKLQFALPNIELVSLKGGIDGYIESGCSEGLRGEMLDG